LDSGYFGTTSGVQGGQSGADLWRSDSLCFTDDAFLGVEDDLSVVRLTMPDQSEAFMRMSKII
jgi:hypothetical protein